MGVLVGGAGVAFGGCELLAVSDIKDSDSRISDTPDRDANINDFGVTHRHCWDCVDGVDWGLWHSDDDQTKSDIADSDRIRNDYGGDYD